MTIWEEIIKGIIWLITVLVILAIVLLAVIVVMALVIGGVFR
jgi:hypothetical protein